MTSPPSAAIALFAKPPTPGRVKTRLARDLGDRRAAGLATALLADTWAHYERVADALGMCLGLASTEVFVPPGEGGRLAREPGAAAEPGCTQHRLWLQGDGDLGDRIERVCRAALTAAPVAVAVGADVPPIPAATVATAVEFASAEGHAVLAPALDGGFCLLALPSCPIGLFAELPWSTSETCDATEARLVERGFRVTRLEPWFDVDELDDLPRLRAAMSDGTVALPATDDWFARVGADDWLSPPAATSLSVVIPTLDEVARIGERLERLLALPGFLEFIVADGGSSDGTLDAVRRVQDAAGPLRVRWLHAPRGRAAQMNAGAACARGDRVLFLHADTRLPDDAADHVRRTLARPGVLAGAFKTWTVDDTGAGRLGPLLHLADVRSRYSSLPYGDQAMFMRRDTFDAVGGFPDLPLMEDLELSLRLRRMGRIETAPASVRVSGRRFIERPVFYTLLVNIYPALYRLGVPADTLARWYRHVR